VQHQENKKTALGWVCGLSGRVLFSKHKALNSSLRTGKKSLKKERKRTKRNERQHTKSEEIFTNYTYDELIFKINNKYNSLI
jgi:hypothetical protein